MKNLVLDSQILTSISHCPYRCKLSFVDRLKSNIENRSFSKGSMLHIGLETYYNLMKEGLSFAQRYDESLVTANKFAVTETNLEQEDIDLVLMTLDAYFKYRRDDRLIVHAVEAPFSKVLYQGQDLKGEDLTILYQGKVDLIAEEEGEREVIDHKSTSKNAEPVDLRVQFMGYRWATGYKVVANRIGFQKTLAPSQKFKRFPFHYSKEAIENWEKFAIRQALSYAYYLEEGEFPQNFASCDTGYGACQYINICRYPELEDETRKFEFSVGEVWDVFREKNT